MKAILLATILAQYSPWPGPGANMPMPRYPYDPIPYQQPVYPPVYRPPGRPYQPDMPIMTPRGPDYYWEYRRFRDCNPYTRRC